MPQKMTQLPPNPRADYEKALISLALTEMLSKEGCEPPVDELPASERDALARSAQHLRDKLPDLYKRGKRRTLADVRQSLQSALPAIKAAALVILIGNMMLTLAAAATGALQTTYNRLLIEEEDKFFSLRHQTDEQLVDVPKGWAGPFYPAHIPEGYEIQRIVNETSTYFFEAYNTEGQHFFFFINPAYGRFHYDNDGDPYDIIAVNQYAGYVFTNDFETMILWNQNGYQVSVRSDCAYDELLRAAQSVFPIP